MALPKRQVAELRAVLRRFSAQFGAAALPTAAGRALEAWLTMRLAHVAYRTGRWRVAFVGSDGRTLRPGAAYAFPAGQGGIPAKRSGGPSHVRLVSLDDRRVRLELHAGLQWLGRSGATHECDVSLLPSRIAEPLRRAGGGRPRGLPIAAYECKDRQGSGQTDEMRQTLARLFDMALVTMPYPDWGCRMFESETHRRWGRHRSRYLDFFATGAFGVVRAGTFSSGGRTLGRHHAIGRYGSIYKDPRSIAALEKAFRETLERIDAI